ncbi:MAG: tRNA (guanosine(37)-N1)-methyltransferase TrmD, partial [Chitinophagaceae bacterium]
MRFDIISVLPDLLVSPFAHSILQRAQKKGIAEIVVHNLRDYATNKQKSVDDYPYGGGSGMVMSIPPFAACIEKLQEERTYDEIIFMSPDGETLNQTIANELSIKGNIIILCGHYKGIDQRIRDIYVTREISIGDYVLSGGELPAAVLVDAITRLIPGVLNDETSALSDSFQGELLDAPVYTRPAEWRGHK